MATTQDTVRNSFIANVNLLVRKLDLILDINNKFTNESIDAMIRLVKLELQVLVEDLKKGTYFGKRKLDINLLLNLKDYDPLMTEEQKLELWSLSSNLVGYSGATVSLIDGTKFTIMFDAEAFSNNDLYHQINRNITFREKVTGTELLWGLEPITGGITRFVDMITITESDASDDISNLESITLHVKQSGKANYKDVAPVYSWIGTTSALELVASNLNYVMDLLAKYPDFVYYGKLFEIITLHISQLLTIEDNIEALVTDPNSLYNNINELKSIYNSLIQINSVYDNLVQINTIYNSLDNLEILHNNLPQLTAIFDRLAGLSLIFNNMDKLITGSDSIFINMEKLLTIYNKLDVFEEIHDNIDVIPDSLADLLEAVETAEQFIKNLKTLKATAESTAFTNPPSAVYTLDNNTLHFTIPEGKPGKDLKVNGSLPSTDDLPTTGSEGDMWIINGHLWVWNPVLNRWEDNGEVEINATGFVVTSDGSIDKFIGINKALYNGKPLEEQEAKDIVWLIDDPFDVEEDLTPDEVGRIEAAITEVATQLNTKANQTDLLVLQNTVDNLEVTGGFDPTPLQQSINAVASDVSVLNSVVATKADMTTVGVLQTALGNKAEQVDLNAVIETVNNLVIEGGGIPEAPTDGKIYGRKDSNWTEVVIEEDDDKFETTVESINLKTQATIAVIDGYKEFITWVDTSTNKYFGSTPIDNFKDFTMFSSLTYNVPTDRYGIAISGDLIVLGGSTAFTNGINLSLNKGQTFNKITIPGMTGSLPYIIAVAVNKNVIIAESNTNGQIFLSKDKGVNWTLVYENVGGSSLKRLAVSDDVIIIDSKYSIDGGNTFNILPSPPGSLTGPITVSGTRIIAFTASGGIATMYRTDDYGVTWVETGIKFANSSAFTIKTYNSYIVCCTAISPANEVYVSDDSGNTWNIVTVDRYKATQLAVGDGWFALIPYIAKGLIYVEFKKRYAKLPMLPSVTDNVIRGIRNGEWFEVTAGRGEGLTTAIVQDMIDDTVDTAISGVITSTQVQTMIDNTVGNINTILDEINGEII